MSEKEVEESPLQLILNNPDSKVEAILQRIEKLEQENVVLRQLIESIIIRSK